MNRFLLLVIAFAIAVLGPVSAETFYRFGAPAGTSVSVAGLVADNGTIINGKGFSVRHLNTGHYLIEFDPGIFPSGCAAMAIEGYEHVIASEVFMYPTDCRHTEWHVGIRDPKTHELMDANFQFIAVEEPRR
jgi:hypothetical protein